MLLFVITVMVYNPVFININRNEDEQNSIEEMNRIDGFISLLKNAMTISDMQAHMKNVKRYMERDIPIYRLTYSDLNKVIYLLSTI